jgi:hypothetical protein
VRFHKSDKRFQVSICAGPSESSVHANFLELRYGEVRILGILRSSEARGATRSRKKFRIRVAHSPHCIQYSSGIHRRLLQLRPTASKKEEARHKGGKDRGKGIAARSQRERRKESVSMPSFLLCVSSTHPTLRFRSRLGQRKGASPKLRVDVSLKP